MMSTVIVGFYLFIYLFSISHIKIVFLFFFSLLGIKYNTFTHLNPISPLRICASLFLNKKYFG